MTERVFLYVEDDPLSREAITVILKRVMKAEHVYVFEDSKNFVERMKGLPHRPDIILLDIHMQPVTGFEVLRILRDDLGYTDARIIALTASVMNEEVKLLQESGFDGVIGKPINVASFPTLIERVANGETIWHITDIG
jgi:two-component system chemotaxis sensor kinase CheA